MKKSREIACCFSFWLCLIPMIISGFTVSWTALIIAEEVVWNMRAQSFWHYLNVSHCDSFSWGPYRYWWQASNVYPNSPCLVLLVKGHKTFPPTFATRRWCIVDCITGSPNVYPCSGKLESIVALIIPRVSQVIKIFCTGWTMRCRFAS